MRSAEFQQGKLTQAIRSRRPLGGGVPHCHWEVYVCVCEFSVRLFVMSVTRGGGSQEATRLGVRCKVFDFGSKDLS